MSATMITAAIATIATVDAARITRALLSGEPAGETDRSLRIVPARLREMRAREPNARGGRISEQPFADRHSSKATFFRRGRWSEPLGWARRRSARSAASKFAAPRGHG